MRPLPLLLALACADKSDPVDDTDAPLGLDLTEPVDADHARAGVVTDPAALIGGVTAEGRPGDVVLYNDRVRWVIQGVRPGNYYFGDGGGVIDADILRGDGQPGFDLVEEFGPVFNTSTVLEPAAVTVLNDGTNGEAARIQVDGVEAPLALLGGTLEAPDLIRTPGLTISLEYVLEPGSWLLEARATVRTSKTTSVIVSDVLIGAPEVSRAWRDSSGFDDDDGLAHRWIGYIANDTSGAVGLFPAPGAQVEAGALSALSGAAELVAGNAPRADMAADEERTFTRYYGVGPDMASLTAEWLTRAGEPTQTYEGQVTAADGPVAGAFVHLLVDGEPFTVARTDADGRFSTLAPPGAVTLADGTGSGLFNDLPAGAGLLGPYTPEPARTATLDAIASGSAALPAARARGVADPASPLTLGQPGVVRVEVDDGLPFTAWLDPLDPQPARDPRLTSGAPSGHVAAGFARDGSVDLLAPPGRYRLVAHRGLRYEVASAELTLAAGETVPQSLSLTAAYTPTDWLLGDPHSHAAPSGDANISMEDRLIVHAASGYQVHFGTDHDHIANYRPLLGPLGLASVMATVVADEVSPPLRGHFNIYPIEPSDAPNGGAFMWWLEIPESTDWLFGQLRARQPNPLIIQSNHPLDSGMGSSAGWSAGAIDDANLWANDFDAVEVLNAGDTEYLAFYLDTLLRGKLSTPVGVTDSHAHFAGGPGINGTFLGVGTGDPTALTDAALVEAMKARRTIVTRGPFLELSVDPGSTVTGPTDVAVTARTPSWIQVDRLILLKDGVEVERVAGTSHTFSLAPAADAAYVILAEGDTPMQPVSGSTPWAMASPILVDVDGDGWTPPLPPLVFGG